MTNDEKIIELDALNKQLMNDFRVASQRVDDLRVSLIRTQGALEVLRELQKTSTGDVS